MAEILGTKKPSISQWENGTSTPSFAMFCDLVTYFNISADYLLGRSLVGGEAPPPIDPEVAGYLDKARAVLESPDGAHLKAVIEAMSKARSS